ncbi:MAG: sulfotransferase [Arenicella sp.]|nr:sulfotransferase [Arenicella sp.]
MSTNIVILNSFDRSGSSVIARTLASHPQIELLFQPFNSGSIRRKMNIVLTDDSASEEDRNFFVELNQGRFDRDYVESGWFEKYSTADRIIPGKLTIIKTTLNHLTISWVRKNFPNIHFWGIWRDPYDILASLIRNDFYNKWFKTAAEQLITTISCSPEEFPPFFANKHQCLNGRPARILAWILSVRNYYFFDRLNKHQLLDYEQFKFHPTSELDRIQQAYNLARFRWPNPLEKDLNVVGKPWVAGGDYKSHIPVEDQEYIDNLFEPLIRLREVRFGVPSRSCRSTNERETQND